MTGAGASLKPSGWHPPSWPPLLGGGVLSGFLGGSAVGVVACVGLVLWLLVRAIPRGAIVVPGAIAAWCAGMVWLLG
jgi:hypothetical protein